MTHGFAELIRVITELSEESTIPLKNELKICKAYLDLESLRFGDAFSYEVIIDEAVDLSFIETPSFIIQPYLENAIWHGLLEKEGEKHLILKVELEEDGLRCIIDDNGIGRERAKEIQRNALFKKKSVGIKNTKERLKIYEELNDIKINVDIIDKVNSKKESAGTKVDIFISS